MSTSTPEITLEIPKQSAELEPAELLRLTEKLAGPGRKKGLGAFILDQLDMTGFTGSKGVLRGYEYLYKNPDIPNGTVRIRFGIDRSKDRNSVMPGQMSYFPTNKSVKVEFSGDKAHGEESRLVREVSFDPMSDDKVTDKIHLSTRDDAESATSLPAELVDEIKELASLDPLAVLRAIESKPELVSKSSSRESY